MVAPMRAVHFMNDGKIVPAAEFRLNEAARARELGEVWDGKLDDVFTEIAPHYNLASDLASFGLFSLWRVKLVAGVDVGLGDRVLDVCAGPNAVGLGLLRRHPHIRMHALDRNNALLAIGRARARTLGRNIDCIVGDAHHLPYRDSSFDAVTMMWAGRHLRLIDAFSEVRRVLRPGGHFYYGDILRPEDDRIKWLFGVYLNACVAATALAFRCGAEARQCRDYFVRGIEMHYSASEMTSFLKELGFPIVRARTAPGGLLGIHRAEKPRRP